MPIICRHRQTGEVASAHLRNNYDLPYYGAIWWGDMESAKASRDEMLAAHGVSAPEEWELHEINEHVIKLINVKLNNNAARKVIMEPDGLLHVITG